MSDDQPEATPKVPPVPDGRYDVMIVDAGPHPTHDAMLQLDITITSGDLKGEVLTLGAGGAPGSDIDLMGLPGTLVVSGGVPTLTIEP